MRKTILAVILTTAFCTLLFGAVIGGYFDVYIRSAVPSNPASGTARLFVSSATPSINLLSCLTSSGVNCMPATIWNGTGSPNGGGDFAPHTMTSATSPSPYVISGASNDSRGPIWGAFDGVASNNCPSVGSGCWSANLPASIELDLGSGHSGTVGNYAINFPTWCCGTNQAPTAWTLQGSNDNSTWTTVDTQSGITWASQNQTQTFSAATATTAYRYFKLNVSSVVSNSNGLVIGEIYLYGAGITSGNAGDYYNNTVTGQWYGPRPSGGAPTWPLISQGQYNHLVGNSSAPTGTLGTGAGTGATKTIAGTDLAGEVCITTAGTPSASATVITLTYNGAYGSTPYMVLTPANANAAALGTTGTIFYNYGSSSGSSAVWTVGSTALTTSTQYCYTYSVQQ